MDDFLKRGSVVKEFTFDAAHLLPGHGGKCQYLHGHTYRVQIELWGEIRPSAGQSDDGMVVDFGDLTVWMKEEFLRYVDHRYLNEVLCRTANGDPAVWNYPRTQVGEPLSQSMPSWLTPIRTTAENLCVWLWDFMSMNFEHGDLLSRIRVWETPTSYAEVSASDLQPDVVFEEEDEE